MGRQAVESTSRDLFEGTGLVRNVESGDMSTRLTCYGIVDVRFPPPVSAWPLCRILGLG